MAGPLNGLTVVEMAGIGPGPFCAMMLADMGADVIRIDRLAPGFLGGGGTIIDRGRRTIALDLKKPGATDIVLRLLDRADALLEGFRPGVMERLGLGPDECLARNPRLVYGRMTGWGQDGPLAQAAGHDLNYIAITGALHAMGHADRPPTPPLHLVGDMAGGAMMLAFGVLCGLLEAGRTGRGQVVDAAICDGASLLASAYHGKLQDGGWINQRQSNMLDGGAHFYGCYACADGKYVSMARSNRSSTACCWSVAASTTRTSSSNGNARNGRSCAPSWPASSRAAPASNGARCSKARMPASRRCWTSRKRRGTPTMWRATVSSKPAASCTPPPRRGFRARPGRLAQCPRPVRTQKNCWRNWAWRQPRSRPCANAAPSPERPRQLAAGSAWRGPAIMEGRHGDRSDASHL
jgi:crotonobetainyl-CoA:carnitine CoA-transferase CaiB-like acyl-CoA transferase